ncbi:DUF4238 domain-containing protein [Emcibacter sp.]|uniref:DUF4238 domain-containing protein n=1 Tax=Emcibacter sp. TaxID=1979954 RepID=UPI003A9117EE
MAGKKQHYIPQVLLRNFGIENARKKKVQVVVYSLERGCFTTSTERIAAERFFYSRPAERNTSDGTLDDKITRYESELASKIKSLLTRKLGEDISSNDAAEVVTHLVFRQKHTRETLTSAFEQLVDKSSMVLSDFDQTKQFLGLNEEAPKGALEKILLEFYEENKFLLTLRGFSNKDSFLNYAFEFSKFNFKTSFDQNAVFFQNVFQKLTEKSKETAYRGHTNALGKTLIPEQRVNFLKSLRWQTISGLSQGLILPDCVSVSYSSDTGYIPLMFAGQKIEKILLPLSKDCLLIGGRKKIEVNVEQLNANFAACSYDFFVASEQNKKFQKLMSKIRTIPQSQINQIVEGAFDNSK